MIHSDEDPELNELRAQAQFERRQHQRLLANPHCQDPDHPGCPGCEPQDEPRDDQWQDTAPATPGQWVMRCDEGGDEETPVDVRLDKGLLMATDPDFGYLPVQELHEGLTHPQWRQA